ncbi:MAG: glycosyltransferase family 9 protein [Leptolyngbyaceae cyanobacterium]
MQLFSDQPLRERPHIAVLGSHKLGNFVVTTPLLRSLKAKYPDCTLDFFGSDLTRELETHLPTLDWRFSLHCTVTGANDGESESAPKAASEPTPAQGQLSDRLQTAIQQRRYRHGHYDLAINCDEYSALTHQAMAALHPTYVVGGATASPFKHQLDFGQHPVQCMLQDPNWNGPTFAQKYRAVTQTNYITELLCRLAYVETDFTRLDMPTHPPRFKVPDVLVHVTASRAAKLWVPSYWQQVIAWCHQQGLSVGLVGDCPAVQRQRYHAADSEDHLLSTTGLIDLRGQATLPQLAGALAQTQAFVTVDTGPLHMAAAVGCPTVAIFGNDHDGDGASPVRLWAPRQPWVKLALSAAKCTRCQEQRFKNQACLQPQHHCMVALPPQTVIKLLQDCLGKSEGVMG